MIFFKTYQKYVPNWMTGCTFDHFYLLSRTQSPPSCISCYRATLLFCSLLSH
nr:MAG TPA: hypothetical protein [Caudoviricetes sp.]DAE89677.1 MAG TPA: hypothetical protein [Bacteriophage sp.]DAT49009.1 MAG TPA: hypothetical protein [Caudoviricetes sp.]